MHKTLVENALAYIYIYIYIYIYTHISKVRLRGPGLVGLRNLGSSCYISLSPSLSLYIYIYIYIHIMIIIVWIVWMNEWLSWAAGGDLLIPLPDEGDKRLYIYIYIYTLYMNYTYTYKHMSFHIMQYTIVYNIVYYDMI